MERLHGESWAGEKSVLCGAGVEKEGGMYPLAFCLHTTATRALPTHYFPRVRHTTPLK